MSDLGDTIPGQLDEIRTQLRVGARRMNDIERRLEENTSITRENTAITRENTAISMQVKDLLDMQNTARVGYKAARGLGKFIAWAAATAGGITALWAFLHHGPKP